MITIREKITPYSITIGLIVLLLVALFVQQFFFTSNVVVDDTVKVGIVDSGCAESQSDHVVEFQSFTNVTYGFTYDDNAPYDNIGHGTQVCDLVIQQAPEVAIISAKIALVGQITYQAVLAAIEWLILTHEVDIINLSLGSDSFISSKLSEIFEKYQNSTLFVVSSGNQGTTQYYDYGYVDWPSIYPWVVGVGASNSDNKTILAGYSSHGIGYYGTYVNQFVENGGSGTSFSTPKITGKLANFLLQLRRNGVDPSYNELCALFIAHNKNKFDGDLGWGYPSNPSLNKTILDSKYFFIHGNTTFDPLIRFNSESWKRTWKVSTYGFDESDFDNYVLSGNGSSIVKDVNIRNYNWGTLLEISFSSIDIEPSNYEIQFEMGFSNNLTYQMRLSNQTVGKTLIDSRFSINGYSHPYGEYLNFEKFLRSMGYIVHHAPNMQIETLNQYNLSVVTSIGQYELLNGFSISPELNIDLIQEYDNYITQGGKVLFMGYHTRYTNYTITSTIGQTFGFNQTNIELGNYNLGDRASGSNYIDDITDQPIGDGVVNFKYQGSEVKNLTNSVQTVAWSTKNQVEYSVGVFGQFGAGYFMYFGGTATITNVFFEETYGINFDRFVTNLLQLN